MFSEEEASLLPSPHHGVKVTWMVCEVFSPRMQTAAKSSRCVTWKKRV